METKVIAHIRSALSGKFGAPRQSGLVEELKAEIHFTPGFRKSEALRGLEGFDYVWLLWEFSQNRIPDVDDFRATVRPPRLGGNTRMGVFATRSPYRPNAIGLSCVRLEKVDFDRCILLVRGADLVDGTPILDIKPYISYTDAHSEARCGFTDDTGWKPLKVIIPEERKNDFTREEAEALEKLLSLDPRPRYQDDRERVYGLTFSGREVKFRVEADTLTVI